MSKKKEKENKRWMVIIKLEFLSEDFVGSKVKIRSDRFDVVQTTTSANSRITSYLLLLLKNMIFASCLWLLLQLAFPMVYPM